MVKINPPFEKDELDSIENIMRAGYSRKIAEGTILNLRKGMRLAHCTEYDAWIETQKAISEKKT